MFLQSCAAFLAAVADNGARKENKDMKTHNPVSVGTDAISIALAALRATGIAGSASAIDWGREAHQEDSRTCESFGAVHGREYTRCMMEQQRRRDDASAQRFRATAKQC